VAQADVSWIYIVSAAELEAQIAQLQRLDNAESLPLYGVPFAVKDNIDVAGLPTTAACPAYTYIPEVDAESVARLRKAGAIVIGKTNLDQFATGLVGTRVLLMGPCPMFLSLNMFRVAPAPARPLR
jgi:allophanate hydrolase